MRQHLTITTLLLLLGAGTAGADVTPMRTPSGNIHCSVGEGAGGADIICDIHERSGPPAMPKPGDCRDAWGHRFELRDRGPVRMHCQAPGAKNNAPGVVIMEYGQTGQFAGITCTSSSTGLTCRNADGHGFALSRSSQTVQ